MFKIYPHSALGDLRTLYQAYVSMFPRLLLALLLLLIVVAASMVIQWISKRCPRSRFKAMFWCAMVQIIIWVSGILAVLVIVFPAVTPFRALTMMTVGGVVFTLVARNMVEGFFTKLLMLWKMPFAVGDAIKLGYTEGILEEVSWCGMTLRDWEDLKVRVPFSMFWRKPLTVQSSRRRRLSVHVVLEHDNPIEDVAEAMRQAVEAEKSIGLRGEVEVVPTAIDSHSTEFLVSWWTEAEQSTAKTSSCTVLTILKDLPKRPETVSKKKTSRKKQQ